MSFSQTVNEVKRVDSSKYILISCSLYFFKKNELRIFLQEKKLQMSKQHFVQLAKKNLGIRDSFFVKTYVEQLIFSGKT